jgi:hypothetical protein
MKLIGIEKYFPTKEMRDARRAAGLEASDPSAALHSGVIEGRLLDLAQDRLAFPPSRAPVCPLQPANGPRR